jgi:hypothetical protein
MRGYVLREVRPKKYSKNLKKIGKNQLKILCCVNKLLFHKSVVAGKVSEKSGFHSLVLIEAKLPVKRAQNCFHLACNGIIQVIYVSANGRDCFENISAGWTRLKEKI